MVQTLIGTDIWALVLGVAAGLACGFLNTAASSGSAVSLPILLLIGIDPVSANATNRVPVLVAAIAGTAGFHRKGAILWDLAIKVSLPVTIGALPGAVLAEIIPGRDLALIITAAIIVAFILLFAKLKQAIERAAASEQRYGIREFAIFVLIGAWLGFIVIDGATYMLLALVLAVGLPLVQANGIKNFVLIPTTILALAYFASHGHVNWTIGAIMSLGAVAGGVLGAHVATSEYARQWVFYLLVAILLAEIVHLILHYGFDTW
jgi:hypothetical protein